MNIKYHQYFHVNLTNNTVGIHIWITDTVLQRAVRFPGSKDLEADGVRGDPRKPESKGAGRVRGRMGASGGGFINNLSVGTQACW